MLGDSVHRAVLLMGPRRVGKTVLLHHLIARWIDSGRGPDAAVYISVDHPIYNGLSLETLLDHFLAASGRRTPSGSLVIFDEVQYLKDWELHLKALVDRHRDVRFVASGSAAAALRLKGAESGAGRFTNFLLPPLTFHEFLVLTGRDSLVMAPQEDSWATTTDIGSLNEAFVGYLNYGGYPEAATNESIQRDPGRFIKSDIIDKVLLRDLPSLYGIQDIQELNSLFTSIAYNTAGEVGLESLSKSSGVSKTTISRYLSYLEAAFLIRMVKRVDQDGRSFQRARQFKVYLTNPSLRCALFSPVGAESQEMGALVETAAFAQWFHSEGFRTNYARWRDGEVDMVYLTPNHDGWAAEIKWSDRPVKDPTSLQPLIRFCQRNRLNIATVTTRTVLASKPFVGVEIELIPAALYCYSVGYWSLVDRSFATRGPGLGTREPLE